MTEHNLFYYPYASFTNAQVPLLKVAALYFDRLHFLDPVGASWGTIGADYSARRGLKLLSDVGILEVISPAEVLAKYGAMIKEAILQDIRDTEFLELCERRGGGRWTLSLAKVPQELQTDQAMGELMGDFARRISAEAGRRMDDYVENKVALSYLPGNETNRDFTSVQAGDFKSFVSSGRTYDEYREGYTGDVEYRYGEFPLALGEAIMMNHALFASLLHANATPITDDPFHNQALSLKLRRASQEPLVQKSQAERAQRDKVNQLAIAALTDRELQLPVLDPRLPLEVVLEYRQKHNDALQQTRDKLGRMARRIETEPWSEEFTKELRHKILPDLADELSEAAKARDAWLKGNSARSIVKGAGIVIGAAAAVLTVFTAPITPLALAVAGLGLAGGAAIPGAEWLLDWRDGKKSPQENGLHYLLRI